MSDLEHTVLNFLAAEEAKDILRKRRASDRRHLRAALELAESLPDNDGAKRLKRWALERYA